MPGWALLLAQLAPTGSSGPTGVDLTVYGVAATTIGILLALLYAERSARTKSDERVVDLAQTCATVAAESAAALNRNADATRDLTAEVRDRGRR